MKEPLVVPEPAMRHVTLLQATLYAVQAAVENPYDEEYFGAMKAAESIVEKGLGVKPTMLVCYPGSPESSATAIWLNPKVFEPVTEILEFNERDTSVYQAMLSTKEYQLRSLCDHS